MATSTTTIRTTTTSTCGAFGPESDRLYSFRSLHDAYISCRRRKRHTINALRFEASLLDNLCNLSASLADGSYKPSRSVCFVAKQPKHREIFAADFRDRVVHHLLVPEIEKIFEPKFIYDSYACRVGKGTHAAVARLKVFMNCVTKGGRIPAWFLQLDIKSFFMSIDREILLQMLSRHLRDERLMSLARRIVLQDCTRNFIYKGDPKLLKAIPPHKSLFHISEGKGLPIGNLTSQFFGNVYLNELDQFIKHQLKVKFYLRYVDDFILLDTDRDRLLALREKIAVFLRERLALELKLGMVLKRVSEGANFLGYIVRPDYMLVRSRVIGNLRARLREFEKNMVVIARSGVTKQSQVMANDCMHIHLREENVRQLRQTLASYFGHFKHAAAYRLTSSLFEKFTFLKEIFIPDSEGHLAPLSEPPFEPANLRGQYAWARKQYQDFCIFFQIGRFCEFYGEQAERYGGLFGLSTADSGYPNIGHKQAEMTKKRKGIEGMQCGFPLRMLKGFKKKAIQAGMPYVVIGERGYYPKGLKKRIVTEIYRLSRRD